MGGKLSGGLRLPNAQAREIAEKVIRVLGPYLERFEICGSIRRGKPECGDADIVVQPKGGKEQDLEFKLASMWGLHVNGKAQHSGLVDEFQVDVVVTTPGSWGAGCQFFTGSAQHNIVLRRKAKEMGLLINEKGCFRRVTNEKGKEVAGEKVAGETEESLYAAVGMTMPEPKDREVE